MPRCGCAGRCSCVISAGNGLNSSGSGNPNDPQILEVDGSTLVGPGLAWDSDNGQFRVRTSGAGLGFNGAGALINTGGGGDGGTGGGGNPFPLVSDLLAQGQDVIGGLHGAGYMIKPAQLKHSYEYGLERGLDMMHVPVRFLRDGTPVVHWAENMGSDNLSTLSTSSYVQEQDIHRWRILSHEPGMWNPRQAWQPNDTQDPLLSSNWDRTMWHTYAPGRGWFGYLEPNQYGLTTLDEIMRLCAGWTVLVLDLLWPGRDDETGAFEQTTPDWRTQRFLSHVERIIDKYRMNDSVIISSRERSIPGGDTTGEISVFERFFNRGIACGQWFNDATAAEDAMPDSDDGWDPRASFAFVHWSGIGAIAPELISNNVTVIAHHVNRQWMRDHINESGALGVLSGDPEYYAGQIHAHPTLGGYRYRKTESTFLYDTVDHGMLPPFDEDERSCQSRKRGSQHVGTDYQLYGNEAWVEGVSMYWVLQGWMCPLPNLTDWAMDFEIGWRELPTASNSLYMGVTFGVGVDYEFDSWSNDIPAADAGGSGYQFTYGSNGYTGLFGWSGTAATSLGAPVKTTAFGSGGRRFIIGVNEKGVRVTQRKLADGEFVLEHQQSTTTLAQAHRGGYIYFGRAAPINSYAVGIVGPVRMMPGQGSIYGPQ